MYECTSDGRYRFDLHLETLVITMFVYILTIDACFITRLLLSLLSKGFKYLGRGVILHQELHSIFVGARRELLPIVFWAQCRQRAFQTWPHPALS